MVYIGEIIEQVRALPIYEARTLNGINDVIDRDAVIEILERYI